MKLWWAVLVACGVLAGASAAELRQAAIPGWKLAVHGYTFRSKSLLETIDLVKDMGLPYLSCTRGQKIAKEWPEPFSPTMKEGAAKAIKARLEATGVKIVAYGVTPIPKDEPGARAMFQWAKDWGIEVFYTEVGADQFPLLDKLAAEYGVRVALHNHPKPSHYWSPDVILAEAKDAKHIGVCADTGHWDRSGLDPTECLRKLQGRIGALHFKDLREVGGKKIDQPWGTGANDARGMLAELQRQGYTGVFAIEYEHVDAKLVDNVKACIDWWYRTVAELAPAKQIDAPGRPGVIK
jgi:sugar phosphate isomerase/epimerase